MMNRTDDPSSQPTAIVGVVFAILFFVVILGLQAYFARAQNEELEEIDELRRALHGRRPPEVAGPQDPAEPLLDDAGVPDVSEEFADALIEVECFGAEPDDGIDEPRGGLRTAGGRGAAEVLRRTCHRSSRRTAGQPGGAGSAPGVPVSLSRTRVRRSGRSGVAVPLVHDRSLPLGRARAVGGASDQVRRHGGRHEQEHDGSDHAQRDAGVGKGEHDAQQQRAALDQVRPDRQPTHRLRRVPAGDG